MKNTHSHWLKMNWRRQCRPLTLRELILKSDFHAMMEHITNFSERMIGLDRHFYRAVEYIRTMKVKYDPDYILAKNYNGWPTVCNLEGNSWHKLLGHPVQRAKDLHCTDTQLAAQCLWHLTFYGFTPEEQHAHFEHENEEIERQMRNDEMCLCDDIYTDEEIKEFALSGLSRVRDEVLERLFTPEEIVEIKKRRKERVDAENVRKDAVDEEERKQLEQETALKLELRKKAEEEKQREWYRKRRRSRRNKHK